MKRNHTTNRVARKPSAYMRKGKAPYQYPAWVTDKSKPIPADTQAELRAGIPSIDQIAKSFGRRFPL